MNALTIQATLFTDITWKVAAITPLIVIGYLGCLWLRDRFKAHKDEQINQEEYNQFLQDMDRLLGRDKK